MYDYKSFLNANFISSLKNCQHILTKLVKRFREKRGNVDSKIVILYSKDIIEMDGFYAYF